MGKKEKQPKQFYWATVDATGFVEIFSSKVRAEASAKRDLIYENYAHVVKLSSEVVKTLRRKA